MDDSSPKMGGDNATLPEVQRDPGDTAMKATTIWQPHAGLIAIGAKPFETRDYPPPAKYIGQRIAIHAAARRPKMEEIESLHAEAVAWGGNMLRQALDVIENAHFDMLPLGAIVCTAILAGAYRCEWRNGPTIFVNDQTRVPGSPSRDRFPFDPFGDYLSGRWAWLLTDIQPLPVPILAKGKQGWWDWNRMGWEAVVVEDCGGKAKER